MEAKAKERSGVKLDVVVLQLQLMPILIDVTASPMMDGSGPETVKCSRMP